MKAITVIIGILLIGTGIYCFVNLNGAYLSLALILGIVITIYGLSLIGTWISGRKDNGVSGWILAEGILTATIGLLIMFYPFGTELVLAIWFAAWLMVSGIMRIIGAIQTKQNFPGSPWGIMLFMGILSTLVGIYGFVHPLVAGMALAILLGVFFIVQGINCIVFGINLPGMKRQTNA